MHRLPAFLGTLILLLGISLGTPNGSDSTAAAATPPTLTNATLIFGDGTGGFITNANCASAYTLWAYDGGGTLLNNPDGSINLPLSVGVNTLTVWGDYFPFNPVLSAYANHLQVSVDGAAVPTLVSNDSVGPANPSLPAATGSVVVGSYKLTVSSFTFTEFTSTNKVSPCVPTTGGGGTGTYAGAGDFNDSTGTVSILVELLPPPLPTTKAQCEKGGWQSYGVFKNQGDCVSFIATKGKNPPAN